MRFHDNLVSRKQECRPYRLAFNHRNESDQQSLRSLYPYRPEHDLWPPIEIMDTYGGKRLFRYFHDKSDLISCRQILISSQSTARHKAVRLLSKMPMYYLIPHFIGAFQLKAPRHSRHFASFATPNNRKVSDYLGSHHISERLQYFTSIDDKILVVYHPQLACLV